MEIHLKGLDWFLAQVNWKVNNMENLSFWEGAWNRKSSLSLYTKAFCPLKNPNGDC